MPTKAISLTVDGSSLTGKIAFAVGESATLSLTCKDPDTLAALNLTGLAVILTIDCYDTKGASIRIRHQASVTNAAGGLCTINIVNGDTYVSSESICYAKAYRADIWAEGDSDHVGDIQLGSGFVEITPAVGIPGEVVSSTPDQTPLGTGPAGSNGTDGATNASALDYTPATPGDWTEGAPSKGNTALDKLAARVSGGSAPVLVDAIMPKTGVVGDVVSVVGIGFTPLAAGSVFVGGVVATFAVVSDTLLTVTIPAGARSGPWVVGDAVTGDVFTVYDPAVFDIDLTQVPPDPRINKSAAGVLALYQGDALAALVGTSGGQFPSPGSIDWTGRFLWRPGIADGNLVFCDVDETTFALRTTDHAMSFMPTFRAVDGSAQAVQGVQDGDELEWRMFYDAQQFAESNLYYRINGIQQLYTTQGGPSGPSLDTPDDFYIGSDNGTDPTDAKLTFFQSKLRAHLPRPEFVFLGDSTTAGNGATWALTPSGLYTPSERWSRAGGFSFAGGGATIEDQATAWGLRGSYIDATGITAAVIMIGINNLDGADSASDAAVKLQSLVDAVRSGIPAGAKIVLSYIVPNANTKVAEYLEDIAGTGPDAITGVDAVCSSFYARLFDGTHGIKQTLQQGDDLHPNSAGRAFIATAWRASLHGLGLL